MDFKSAGDFINEHLRYKQHWKKRWVDIHDAVWQTLDQDTWLNGCEYAAGSRFKVWETQNFGWVAFAPDTKTPNGKIPGKLLMKW